MFEQASAVDKLLRDVKIFRKKSRDRGVNTHRKLPRAILLIAGKTEAALLTVLPFIEKRIKKAERKKKNLLRVR